MSPGEVKGLWLDPVTKGGHYLTATILKRFTRSYKVSYDGFEGSVETVKNSWVQLRKGAMVDPQTGDLVEKECAKGKCTNAADSKNEMGENFTPLPEGQSRDENCHSSFLGDIILSQIMNLSDMDIILDLTMELLTDAATSTPTVSSKHPMKYQFRKQPARDGSKLAEILDGREASEDSDDPENAVEPLEADTSDSEADQLLIKFQNVKLNKKLLWKDQNPNIDIEVPILEKWIIKDVGEPSRSFEPYFSKTWIDFDCQQSNKYAREKDIERNKWNVQEL